MPERPARIEVDYRKLAAIRTSLRDLVPVGERQLGNAIANRLEATARRTAVPHVGPDTGDTARSIESQVLPRPGILARLYSEARWIHAVEYGRRPGGRFPPRQPIEDWMRRHSIDAPVFLIQRAIALRGTRAIRPFATAIEDVRTQFATIIATASARVRNRWESAR